MTNQKLKIITIGGTGLVGSRVNEIIAKKYEIVNLAAENGIDITKPESLMQLKGKKDQFLILYAAKADVDGCEKDKDLGEKGDAYITNVIGVQNVVDAIKSVNTKLIYISTDFVFDGENTPKKGYTEEDSPRPLNWYGKTKYLGEQVIRNSGLPHLIIRISYPYRKKFETKTDFFRTILSRLQNNLPISAVTDHIISPTFIDDIALVIDTLIFGNHNGTYHVTGSQTLSPYTAAMLIAQAFHISTALITPTTRAEFFKNRAPRPFNLTMNNGKIRALGIEMKGFEEGLKNLK